MFYVRIAMVIEWKSICFPMSVLESGFFPALGAALEGINNQGEFRRIEKRSDAMSKRLHHLLKKAIKLQNALSTHTNNSDDPMSLQLTTLANEAARLMVKEVLDWRVIFLDRPLNPAP